MNKEQQKEQMQKLKECVENGVRGVMDGDGLIVIAVTEKGMRVEAFNCDEEELTEALAAAHCVVSHDDDDDEEGTLQ